ncbi:hypothetical protein BH23PSE2_BH23PSE2_10420 [soil metagenome]
MVSEQSIDFEVHAQDGALLIGTGIHSRASIDLNGFKNWLAKDRQ